MLRAFFLGFVKIHILHHAAREPVYGLALIEELARHGYTLSAGTLYPVLHTLERDGYLQRQDRLVGGKIRKYYLATAAGRAGRGGTGGPRSRASARRIADEPDKTSAGSCALLRTKRNPAN